jgi:hypothetical protein
LKGGTLSGLVPSVHPAVQKYRRSKLINQANISGSFLKLTHSTPLTLRTKTEQCSSYVLIPKERDMLKTFVEEAAALASIVLFVGMIAVWAQLIPQL